MIVALLRTDGVANGAGKSFKLTGFRPRWADTVTAEAETMTRATIAFFMDGVLYGP